MLRFPLAQFDAFTDRRLQVAAFRRLLAADAACRILVFTGVSGNGKSFLVDYLTARELPPETPHALLDFEGDPDLLGDPAALLNRTLSALEPLPDRARHSYREQACAIQDRRDAALGALTIHQEARAAGGAQMDARQDVNLGSQLAAIHTRARRELAEALVALARAARRPAALRAALRVIFIDGYEFLRRGDERYEAWAWEALCDLSDALPGLRVVVAGREAPRPPLPAERPDDLRLFTARESAAYLAARGVADGPLHARLHARLYARLHALTGGHPLLLSMAADLAQSPAPLTLHEMETAPAAAPDQRPVTAWLYGRILDRLPPETRALAESAALLRRFDVEALAALADVGEDGADKIHPGAALAGPDVRAFVQTHTSWLRPHAAGGWVVHDLVGRARAAALRQEGPERARAFHRRAAAFWQARWESDQRHADLAEAFYHAFWVDEEAALGAWDEMAQSHTLVADREAWRPCLLAAADPRLEEKPLAPETRAAAAYRRARWHYYAAEWAAAMEAARQALELYRAVGARLGEANVLQAIGDVQQLRKEMDAALESYAQALDLYRAVGDRLGEANVQKAIGDVQQFRDERDAALESYAQALELYRAVGDRLGEANIYQVMATLEQVHQHYEKAMDYFAQALALHGAIGDTYSQAVDRRKRADTLAALDRKDEARADLEFALQVYTALGLPYVDMVREKLQQL